MNLIIGNYRINHDGINVTLYRSAMKTNPKTLEKALRESIIGHFPTFSQAVARLLEEKIADSTATDLRNLTADLAMRMERISRSVESQMAKIAEDAAAVASQQHAHTKRNRAKFGGEKPSLATAVIQNRKSQE